MKKVERLSGVRANCGLDNGNGMGDSALTWSDNLYSGVKRELD